MNILDLHRWNLTPEPARNAKLGAVAVLRRHFG
jgi:hypothetical protein